jgi:hypothetical protein
MRPRDRPPVIARARMRTIASAFLLWFVALSSTSIAATPPCPEQVTYLSATDKGYQYLEARQHAIYERNPNYQDPFSRQMLASPKTAITFAELSETLSHQGCDAQGKNCLGDPKIFAGILEQLRCAPLPTRFESPYFRVFINLYDQAFDASIKRRYPNAQPVRTGSLPTGTIDAQAIKPLGIDSPIVILNRDLFFFTGAFSKAVCNAIPIIDFKGEVGFDDKPAHIAERLRQVPVIADDFADAVSRMVKKGNTTGAHEVLLDADHNRLHARLVSSMDMFIMLHERAHVLLGHTASGALKYNFTGSTPHSARLHSRAKIRACEAAPEDTTLTLLRHSREDELAADALAFKLLIETRGGGRADRNPVDLMIAAAAADVVFGIIDAADNYNRSTNGTSFTDAAHPSAADRRAALDSVQKELRATGGPLNGVPDFREVFDASLAALLLQTDPAIRKALRPSAASRP